MTSKTFSDDDGVGQISAIIHDQTPALSFASSMRKAACALFLVCLDKAEDDIGKIHELSAGLNAFLDEHEKASGDERPER